MRWRVILAGESRELFIRCALQTVSENARLDVNAPAGGDDELELWDQSGFMLRGDIDDPLTHSKFVHYRRYRLLSCRFYDWRK